MNGTRYSFYNPHAFYALYSDFSNLCHHCQLFPRMYNNLETVHFASVKCFYETFKIFLGALSSNLGLCLTFHKLSLLLLPLSSQIFKKNCIYLFIDMKQHVFLIPFYCCFIISVKHLPLLWLTLEETLNNIGSCLLALKD